MASVVNLASCILCILCIATMSECTKTSGKKMSNSWPDSTRHQLDVWDISHGDYSSCRQFFKREICDECFLEDSRVSSALPHRGSSSSQRDAPAAPATIQELTRTGSELVSKLERGACALGRPSSSGRLRRSVAMDAGSINASSFVEAVYEKYGTSGVISEDQFESLLQDLGIGKPLESSVEKNQLSSVTNNASIQQCFLADELIEIFNASRGITEKMFTSVCPSLIQQITQGCVTPVTPPKELDPMMYAWATLAVVSITALSMLAMVAVPTNGSRFYAAVMQLFVALAISSLSGDALLHLLPEALGIHGIPSNVDQPNHILIILTIILAIYFFFIFERVMSLCLKGTPYGHGHVHSRPRRETFIEDEGCAETHLDPHDQNNTERGKDGHQDDNDTISNKEVIDDKTSKEKKLDEDEGADFGLNKPELKICGLNKLSFMVLLGDAVHNITDGITIGVSFVNGPYAGASTTIAVFFHEVPHEIGDFAVMLRSGVSFRKAMLCSLISNLVGFAGLYAGLLLGSENNVQRWIFAATAGMFLYIALVSLVPEMNQQAEEAQVNPWRVFLRHNIGLILGWAIMLALGINEQVADHLN